MSKQLTLSDARLERVSPWGAANHTLGWVFRPSSAADVAATFELARRDGLTVAFRGGGNSYGDAACNSEGIVLDLRRYSRILEWDAESGIISMEPGVTLRQLWEYVLEDGWWPPVCTGTMEITMGGGAAMNVHGKNAYKLGPFGNHILDFDILMPNGESKHCSRDENSDLFHAAIGGFGMLGCFTQIRMQMKRVYSGLLAVGALVSRDFGQMFEQFEALTQTEDYVVGWVDGASKGKGLGRGQIHIGRYLKPGEDPHPQQTLRLSRQNLTDTMFGFFPRSQMWRLMKPFMGNAGVRLTNTGKYLSSIRSDGHKMQQPHAQFHFLLNYFPGWQKSLSPGGLIQYQPFVPKENAEETFKTLLRLTQKRKFITYLGVLKRHIADPFWMTHGLDGYSLAMDFRITDKNRAALAALAREMDEIVLAAGGRFYFAKDSTLRPEVVNAYLGDDVVSRFRALKRRYDPDHLLQTNLWRRLFP